MKVDEVDGFALRLAQEIRKAQAVAGHDSRLLPKLQRLEKTVENAHLTFHKALGRRNPTLASRQAKIIIEGKDQLIQLMKGPKRLDIHLNLDF